MKRTALLSLAIAIAFFSLAAARRRAVSPPTPTLPAIRIERSMVITDPGVIDGITFERVVQTLIERGGANMTPLQLYRQWFDTQNPKPGMAVVDAPHCDDFTTNGLPSFNGFYRRCPTPEGILATTDPFTAHEYTTTGITNRFDQTPADGSNCGQYRILFARTNGTAQGSFLHIIFEGVLPNPTPSAGIAACRPVAQFWADLTKIDSVAERRAKVEQFFFDGIPGFAPMLRIEHFNNGGRIRTKQVSTFHEGIPRFFQFVIEKRCANATCRLIMQPDVLENMPSTDLYDASLVRPLGPQFRDDFIANIATLARKDLNFFHNIAAKYLEADSDPVADKFSFSADEAFTLGVTGSAAGKEFESRIKAELQRIGSTLTPRQIMGRADMQNCTGCHGGNVNLGEGIFFPAASPIADSHVMQTLVNVTENGQIVQRFDISPALRDVFAPARVRVLQNFLAAGIPPPDHTN
jgi:hypothetical protein